MFQSSFYKHGTHALMVLLLFAVTSRLIWIQARSYHIVAGPRSWGRDLFDRFITEILQGDMRTSLQVSIGLVITMVYLLMLATRYMTGSWLGALWVAVVLLSRKTLVVRIGYISEDVLVWLLSSIWFLGISLRFRPTHPPLWMWIGSGIWPLGWMLSHAHISWWSWEQIAQSLFSQDEHLLVALGVTLWFGLAQRLGPPRLQALSRHIQRQSPQLHHVAFLVSVSFVSMACFLVGAPVRLIGNLLVWFEPVLLALSTLILFEALRLKLLPKAGSPRAVLFVGCFVGCFVGSITLLTVTGCTPPPSPHDLFTGTHTTSPVASSFSSSSSSLHPASPADKKTDKTCHPFTPAQPSGALPTWLPNGPLVVTHLKKTCTTPEGQAGYSQLSDFVVLGFPCSGGLGEIEIQGSYGTPDLVRFHMHSDCPMIPKTYDEILSLVQTVYHLDSSVSGTLYPFALEYWELPLAPAHTLTRAPGARITLTPVDSDLWQRFTLGTPLPVRLFGREALYTQDSFFYQANGHIQATGPHTFKISIDSITTLDIKEVYALRLHCQTESLWEGCAGIGL